MKIDLTTFLPYQLTNLANLVSNDFAKVYQTKYGLTIPQWRILANLAQFGKSNAKDLCMQASMDKSTVSRAVKALIEKQLVLSKINPKDKRVALLILSEKGERVYSQIAFDALNWQAQLLNGLSDSEQQLLINVFIKLNCKLHP